MQKELTYFSELKKAMSFLAEHPKTLFIGQAVQYEGTGLYDSLKHLPEDKRIELPIAEYLQCGLANGLAIEGGIIPVSTFPRFNFLLMGVDQIVNHLDKFASLSDGKCQPKVIIRVAVGSEWPVHPQDQHVGNFANAFKCMLRNIDVVELNESKDILPAYKKALERTDGISTILVEFADHYKTK
jgi:pyruvate/2-oxoglutarate/acetoin dehydrogenase E1 component